MLTICCLCHREIKDDGKNDGRISHGYCPECAEEEIKKIDELNKKPD